MRLLLALLFGSTLLFAAPVPKDKKKTDDAEAILGKWEFDKFDAGGAMAPLDEFLKGMVFEFKKDGKLTISAPAKQKQPAEEGEFKLDDTAKPKELDITVKKQEGTMKGLYELDGDTLKLCIPDEPKKGRPKELKADKDTKVAVITFKRVKEEEKKDK